MNEHKLTLVGGEPHDLRVPAFVLHEAVGALLEGARHATRFLVEGESIRKGKRPAWLDAVCAIDITALSAGSAIIALEAPTLEEADPAKFGCGSQQSLFEEHVREVGGQTAIDLFGEVLASVIDGDENEVLADRSLLDTCLRFARVARGAFDGLRIDGLQGSGTVFVTHGHIPKIELLRDETPAPQAVRVTGTLDTISASRSDVTLTLSGGVKVPARLEAHDQEVLKHLFGTLVVVSGVAHYGPSGRLLLVDVESLKPAREADCIFAAPPTASGRLPVASPESQGETSGVSAFFGTWPGDETEQELLEALRDTE